MEAVEPLPSSSEMWRRGNFLLDTWGGGKMGVKGRVWLVRGDRLIRDLEEGKAGRAAVAVAGRRPIR